MKMKTFLVQYYDLVERKPSDLWVQIKAPTKDYAVNVAYARARKRVGITVEKIVELGTRRAP